MDRVNIFIAEDDHDDFSLLKEALEKVLPLFNVCYSRDGISFLQSLGSNPSPDLIFLDLHIPGKSGIDCLIEVRRDKKLGLVPVIIYSTSSNFDDIDICYRNGCTLYLVKPHSFKDLVNQIRKIFFRIGLPRQDLLHKEMFVVKKHEE